MQTAADNYEAGAISKTRFERLQQGAGHNYNKLGLLWCAPLREAGVDTVGSFRYDWMHALLQDGVYTLEITLFLEACREKIGVTWADLEAFLREPWKFPHCSAEKNKQMYRMFSQWRCPSRDSGEVNKVKAQASELLALHGVLRHYVEVRIGDRPELQKERASYDASCKVLDIIMAAKKRSIPMRRAAVELRAAHADNMAKHAIAYGEGRVKPKTHWVFDVADAFEKDPHVLDMFVGERLHLRIRDAALPTITRRYERTVLASVLLTQHRKLCSMGGGGNGLVGKTCVYPGFDDATLAYQMEIGGCLYTTGDVLVREGEAGKLMACAAEAGDLFFVVEPLRLTHRHSPRSGAWVPRPGVCKIWRPDGCQLAVAWMWHDDSSCMLIET